MDSQLYLSQNSRILPHKEQESCTESTYEEIPLTFRDFGNQYNWPTERALRKMAFDSETNGLAVAFVKFGKRRLVLPQTLFRLIRGGGVK